MNYEILKSFLWDKMRMSHVYQPVMIRLILANEGIAADMDIAKEISQQDPTQIEYYKSITNNMVGRVLRRHGIVEKINDKYVLKEYSNLSNTEIEELNSIQALLQVGKEISIIENHYNELNLLERYNRRSNTEIDDVRNAIMPQAGHITIPQIQAQLQQEAVNMQASKGPNYWRAICKLALANSNRFLVDCGY